jgi:sec-independent protein translocase protein TatA
MGALAPSHWLLLILVVVLLFGTGRISGVMGDFAKGLKAFRKNMADDSDVSMEAEHRAPTGTIAPPPPVAPHAAVQPAPQPQPTTVPHG